MFCIYLYFEGSIPVMRLYTVKCSVYISFFKVVRLCRVCTLYNVLYIFQFEGSTPVLCVYTAQYSVYMYIHVKVVCLCRVCTLYNVLYNVLYIFLF